MKSSLKLLAGIGLGSLFIGCGPDLVETSNSDAKTSGSIQFVVTDSQTGELLDSVKIENSIIGENPSVYTDEMGEGYFTGLDNSEYLFIVSKEGYAAEWFGTTLTIENLDSDAPRIQDLKQVIALNETGAIVSGRIYFNNKAGEKMPALNAVIEVTVGSNFKKRVYTATTDASGKYTIDDLPENTVYSIKVLKYKDSEGTTYQTTAIASNVTTGDVGDEKEFASKTLVPETKSLEIVSDNLSGISSSDAVEITFSQAIDQSEIGINDIKIERGLYPIPVVITYSADKKTVLIKPLSGIWEENVVYDVYASVKGVEGGSINYSSDFEIGEVSLNLGNVVFTEFIAESGDVGVVTLADTYVDLIWEKLDNASYYEVYSKSSEDVTYMYQGRTTSLTYELDIEDQLIDGNQVNVIIVATNSTERSEYSTAKVITLTAE